MKIDDGYMCKKCRKIYHKAKEDLPGIVKDVENN